MCLGNQENVFLPWNTPSYIPLNSFHPLLRRILPKRSYEVPDLNLICSNRELLRFLQKSRDDLARDWEEYSSGLSEYILWEKKLLSRIEMKLEVHHTRIPYTDNDFILHFEDPKTLFFPRSGVNNGMKNLSSIDMEKLFSPSMKLIFSHVKESASELNTYLQDEYGASLNIAISTLNLQHKGDAALKTRHPSIVFTNSLNQSLENFRNRGGLILLNALPELFKKHPDLQVTILGALPSIQELRTLGLRESAVQQLNKVIFYSIFSHEQLIASIFEQSWIYVLPSLNLHTDSIFRALENECHVITSNPHGLKNLLLPYSKKVVHLDSLPTEIRYNQFGFASNCEATFLANSAAAETELTERLLSAIQNTKFESNVEEDRTESKEVRVRGFNKNDAKFIASRRVTAKDWEKETHPIPVFDSGEEKIYRWKEFYFIDQNPPGKIPIKYFAMLPGELLNYRNKREYFGYSSFFNFVLSRVIKIIKVNNYEIIVAELQHFTWPQTMELIRKRLSRAE